MHCRTRYACDEDTGNTIDLSGIDDHTVSNLKLVKAGGVTRTPKVEIIVIINQAAHMPDGRTIISTGQLEWFKNHVDERSKKITGRTPSIVTLRCSAHAGTRP